MASQTKSEPTLPLTDYRPGHSDGMYFDAYPKVEAQCPIDGNYLFDMGYSDGDHWQEQNFTCFACGAEYRSKSSDPEVLKKEALKYLREIKGLIEEKKKEIEPLEAILKAGKENGLIPK